jgi:hypothetical protein
MPLLSYYDYIPTPLPISVFHRLFGRCVEVDVREEFPTPSSSDFLFWYYRTLDCGFALASHAHLVCVTFTHPDGITELQEYTKTSRLSYRWVDYKTRTSAVIVMRSVSEATELFELYEDEESGSDSEFHFVLRPVGSAIVAPYIEDTQLRKLRSTHWNVILTQWAAFKCDSLTIVAFNMNEKFTIQDLEKSLEGIPIVSITIVSEGLRLARRVAYVTLHDHAGVRAALDRDGRNVHGKALRIQMMPPTYEYNRHGTVLSTKTYASAAPKIEGAPPVQAPPKYNAQAKEFTPRNNSPPASPAIIAVTPTGLAPALPSTPTTKWVPNPSTPPFRPRGAPQQ